VFALVQAGPNTRIGLRISRLKATQLSLNSKL
jgi:hypothetical protein